MLQRAGAADDYAGTVPSRQVGILSSEGTDNSFDDFKAMDIAGPFEADGSKPLRASVSPWFYFPSPILHFAYSGKEGKREKRGKEGQSPILVTGKSRETSSL